MTSHDRKALGVKRAAALQSARMGATFRAFCAACDGGALNGIFYALPLAERLDWEQRARKAAEALGMVKP